MVKFYTFISYLSLVVGGGRWWKMVMGGGSGWWWWEDPGGHGRPQEAMRCHELGPCDLSCCHGRPCDVMDRYARRKAKREL